MTAKELSDFVTSIAPILERQIDHVVTLEVQKRIKGLHHEWLETVQGIVDRTLELTPPAKDGAPGKDADPAVINGLKEEIAALQDGVAWVRKQTDFATLKGTISTLVAEHVAALPPAAAGQDGAPGEPGPAGPPGPPGEPGPRGESGLQGTKGDLGERGPEGSQGLPGRDGRDGGNGEKGERGEKGLDGRDGVDGIHGKDGLGFDDLDWDEDERGRLSAKFVRGEVVKMHRLPGFVDCGVWRPETSYLKGDGVTWGGSFWIAQADTADKPGDGVTAWRLAVKQGREGKPGAKGETGPQGLRGEKGLDGRHYSGG